MRSHRIQEQPNGFLLYVHLHPDTKMSDLSAINKWLTELLNSLLFCSNKHIHKRKTPKETNQLQEPFETTRSSRECIMQQHLTQKLTCIVEYELPRN